MGVHKPVELDAGDIARARATWAGFTKFIKWSVIGIAAVLALMALTLIR